MAARFPHVIALRLPDDCVTELKRRAAADDRPLAVYLRRALIAMAKQSSKG
jgi:hypothetical protein